MPATTILELPPIDQGQLQKTKIENTVPIRLGHGESNPAEAALAQQIAALWSVVGVAPQGMAGGVDCQRFDKVGPGESNRILN